MPRIPSGFTKRSASSAAPTTQQLAQTRSSESSTVVSTKATATSTAGGGSDGHHVFANDGIEAAALASTTFWCERPGQGVLVDFKDSWVLELVSGGERETGEAVESDMAMAWSVVVPGICPFHVVAKQSKDGAALCGGIFQHTHETPEEVGPNHINLVTSKSLVLNQPLVTMPMSMHALLLSPELRAASLYFYNDHKFKANYPDLYLNLQGKLQTE
ncbi:hypothetical protein GGI00_006837 [Coemansia sp. RSA 2681]|nr:hypothetical protein GGI00_006837 [Coemansia sp. RSA 2681]